MVLGLLVVLPMVVVGIKLRASWLPRPLVSTAHHIDGGKRDTLFVLIHGLDRGRGKTWDRGITKALTDHGDVLAVRYPAFILSNADANEVSRGVSAAVQRAMDEHTYTRIVLVGYSIGALIARKAFLYASGGTILSQGEAPPTRASWASNVERIVLLAGTNRGWDISGQKPLDMGWGTYLEFWTGSWLGWLTDTARLIRAMETGAPFVANLRLEWMRWYGVHPDAPFVVQLLGDIDDIVSDDDNKDLRVAASSRLFWLRVRGTGHLDIIRLDDPTSESGRPTLGRYRRDKLLLATLAGPEALRRENEEQAYQTDNDVTHLVFILHGIRDLGRWSAELEGWLRRQFDRQAAPKEKLAIASVRYGYFGMGPFILRFDRQKYVRWFMDQYTETLARYPKVQRIDFVGHSNGTYLLASALERYHAMKVDRIVFAGSVVRSDYDWGAVSGQFKAVRNYVASDDWVVALFPRFFEQRPLRFLGNDLGSAGFNGFAATTAAKARIENVEFITGQHSAFLRQVPSIADFLTAADCCRLPIPKTERGERFLKLVSDWACWAVWLVLATIVIGIAAVLAQLTGLLAVPVVVAYAAILLTILYKI